MQEDLAPRCDQAAELVLIKLQSLARSWFVERGLTGTSSLPIPNIPPFPGQNPPPKTPRKLQNLKAEGLVVWLVLKWHCSAWQIFAVHVKPSLMIIPLTLSSTMLQCLSNFLRLFPSLIWSRIIIPNQQHFVLFWTSHRSGWVCYVRSTLSRTRSDGNIKATKRSTMFKGTGSPKPLPIFFKQIYESNRKRQLTLEPLFSRLQLWFLERV